MADENKFEFDIISNDLTDSGNAKATKGIRSVEQEYGRAAAGMSGYIEKANVEIVQSTQKASAAVYRSIQAFERQTSLIGTSGRDRVMARVAILRQAAEGDQQASAQIQRAVNDVIASYRRLDEATSKRTARSAIAETDARFNTDLEARIKQLQANNDAIQRLQQDRIRATETPVQRVARERQDTLGRYGGTAAQRTAIDQEFSGRMRSAQEQELRAGGVAAGKAVLSGEAEFQAALQKMQDNNAAIRKIQEDRARAMETPTQRVSRERTDFISRYGGSDTQRSAIEQEFALRGAAAKQQEVRLAGLAAGKATLSGEAEFQAALRQVQTRDASIREIEERAAKASLSKPDFLRREMEQTLAQAGMTETAAKRVKTAYADLVKAAESEGGHGASGQALRRTILGIKDFLEGSTRGTIIEATDVLVGTSGGGGLLTGASGRIASLAGVSTTAVTAVGSLAAAFVGLQVAGIASIHSLASVGEEISNFSSRTGIAVEHVQAFQYAAKASGQNPEIVERLVRGLAQTADDSSPTGARGRQELQRLGVNLRDQVGDLKPMEQIIAELAEAISSLPPGLQRSAASMDIFKRSGIEAIPFLKEFGENMQTSAAIGGTFSKEEIARFEEYNKAVQEAEERWHRFVLHIKENLATTVTVEVTFIRKILDEAADNPIASTIRGLEPRSYEAGKPNPFIPPSPGVNPRKEYIGPPTGEYGQKLSDRLETDTRMDAFNRSLGPSYELEQARRQLQIAGEGRQKGVFTPKQETDYEAAYNRVQQLESAEKAQSEGMRDVIDARKERLQLESQYAQLQESALQKKLLAGLDTKKELLGPDDITKMLQAAEARAKAEQGLAVESRRKVVNEKTGQIEDLSNTPKFRQFEAEEAKNLPLRIRNEYDKVLSEVSERDTKYFKDRSDADFKAFDEAQKRKVEAQKSLYEETKQLEADLRTQYFQQQSSTIERQKSLALQQLGLRDAQTPQERTRLADAQFGVETYYSRQALALQESKLTADRDIEIGKQQAQLSIAGPAGQDDYDRNVALISQRYSNEIDAARQAESEKELIDAQKTSNEKAKITIEATKSVYQNLKEEANGLFDVLFSRTKSWADFGKQLLKTFVLTPVKDIFSSQVAGFFTQALTGQKVAFNEIGNGQGVVGRAGGILGRLGMGAPRFGDRQASDASKLNLPNHLGDVTLVSSSGGSISSSVPVVITNIDQMAQSHAQAQSQQQGRAQTALFAPIAASVGSLTRAVGMRALPSPVPQTAAVRPPVESAVSRLITSAGSDFGPADFSQLPLNAVTQAPNYQFPNLGIPSPMEDFSSRLITGAGSDYGPATQSVLPSLFGIPTPGAPAFSKDVSSLPLNAVMQAPNFQIPNLDTAVGGSSRGGVGGFFQGLFGGGVTGPNPSGWGGPNSPSDVLLPGQAPGGSSTGGGFLGGLKSIFGGGGNGSSGAQGGGGGLFGGLKSMFGLDTSGTDMGGGVGIVRQGFGGNLAAISKSSGFAMLGGIAAMDGIRRGGVMGTLEAAGGGAAIGFKYGGPWGALIGGAIGAGAALIKTFLGDDLTHTKDLVKQIYGISINDATAKQIIAIAKQSYGGQISMAVRSPEVRNLIRLYAQTIGNPAQAQFVADTVHGSSLVQANGQLSQQAIYDNGSAYAYQSPLSVYGGVQATSLPTYAPNSGGPTSVQLIVNGQSAADLLDGRITNTVTPSYVQGQSASAMSGSIGRNQQMVNTLAPSAITR